MASQWENFLRNLGQWRGSFTSFSAQGVEQESTASLLSLEEEPGERLVRFRLRRYGPEGPAAPPTRELEQELRSLGRQVVFFTSGAFAKGSLQLAPGTPGGGEFAFVHADRRHRLVQLYSDAGQLTGLVLIREFRVGREATERPPLEPQQLVGSWRGEAATISADWPEPEHAECRMVVRAENGGVHINTTIAAETSESPAADGCDRLLLLPDGGWSLTPLQLSHRAPARLEAGWLTAPNRLERLIRRFDAGGAWRSSSWIVAERA
jgi:hypothetical protein